MKKTAATVLAVSASLAAGIILGMYLKQDRYTQGLTDGKIIGGFHEYGRAISSPTHTEGMTESQKKQYGWYIDSLEEEIDRRFPDNGKYFPSLKTDWQKMKAGRPEHLASQ